MNDSILLAVFIYLWAGWWMAYPQAKQERDPNTPLYVTMLAYAISLLAWGLLFPIYQYRSEQQRNRSPWR